MFVDVFELLNSRELVEKISPELLTYLILNLIEYYLTACMLTLLSTPNFFQKKFELERWGVHSLLCSMESGKPIVLVATPL